MPLTVSDTVRPIEAKIDGDKAEEPSVSGVPRQREETVIIEEEYVDDHFDAADVDSADERGGAESGARKDEVLNEIWLKFELFIKLLN